MKHPTRSLDRPWVLSHTSTEVLLCASVFVAGCSFDLEKLKGRGDVVPAQDGQQSDTGTLDDVDDTGLDVPVVDATDDSVDTPPIPDGTNDTGDSADTGDAGSVECGPTLDIQSVGTAFGGSYVLTSSTLNQSSRLTPPTFGPGCAINYSTFLPSPERMFRHVMQSAGNLYATTDAPACEGVFDTIVWIQRGCGAPNPAPTTGNVLACDDDDDTLRACTPTGGIDPSYASSAIARSLTMGQEVFVTTDGYDNRAGVFRLIVTENAGRNEPPPLSTAVPVGYTLADRCACGSATEANVISASFPTSADTLAGTTNPTISGSRTLLLATIKALAFEGRVLTNTVSTATGCSVDSKAIFDLAIDNKIVHSFSVNRDFPAASIVRAAYQSFGSIALTATTAFALRLRGIEPPTCTGTVTFSRSSSGTLTLVGRLR